MGLARGERELDEGVLCGETKMFRCLDSLRGEGIALLMTGSGDRDGFI